MEPVVQQVTKKVETVKTEVSKVRNWRGCSMMQNGVFYDAEWDEDDLRFITMDVVLLQKAEALVEKATEKVAAVKTESLKVCYSAHWPLIDLHAIVLIYLHGNVSISCMIWRVCRRPIPWSKSQKRWRV